MSPGRFSNIADIPIKLLIGILVANILSMILMNGLVIKTAYVVYIYIAGVFISYLLVAKSGLGRIGKNGNIVFSRKENILLVFALIGVSLLLTLPRAGYAAEYFLGYAINPVCADDYWHFQELSSLINTESYPPVSSFDSSKYLSFYYAPWMLVVFIYYAIGLGANTIKASYFMGYTIYIVLVVYSVFYFSYRLSRSKKQFYFLIYIVLLYSGFESIYVFTNPISHNEWWMLNYFGLKMQFSSFSTLTLWVMHHLLSAVSLLLAYYAFLSLKLMQAEKGGKGFGYALVAILLVNAFYSSVFVFLGAMPFVIYVALREFKSNRASIIYIGIISALLASPVLWIYLGKHSESGFILLPHIERLPNVRLREALFSLNALSSFIKFMTLVSLELIVYLIVIAKSARTIWKERSRLVLLVLALGFIVSTFFIAYPGANNYAMRGAIIPLLILGYIVSEYFDREVRVNAITISLLALLALGSFNEAIMFNQVGYDSVFKHRDSLDERRIVYKLNTDRGAKVLEYDNLDDRLKKVMVGDESNFFYLTEKVILNCPRSLREPDMELIGDGPLKLWKYQNWNSKQ